MKILAQVGHRNVIEIEETVTPDSILVLLYFLDALQIICKVFDGSESVFKENMKLRQLIREKELKLSIITFSNMPIFKPIPTS